MEIPWPQKGDSVFREGGRACCIPREIGLIAMGYRKASEILVDYVAQHGRNDGLVFPIIFGYRQYLEVTIKAIRKVVNRFDEAEDDPKKTHDLEWLWNKVRSRLLEELEEDQRVPFEVVEKSIMEFHNIDPKADAFRFPNVINQFNIDLENMKVVMSRVAMFLDSLCDYWEEGVRAKV